MFNNRIRKEKKSKNKFKLEEEDLPVFDEVKFGEVADRPPELRVVPKKKVVASWGIRNKNPPHLC